MAAAGERLGDCSLFDHCFCCWRKSCSRRIPLVAPGRDYVCVPAGADDRPTWSVLVGCASDAEPSHHVRVHRFRVAASGHVIVSGGGDDDGMTLEPFPRRVP
ncbi:hypothetical protein E2562_013711 [Oryza meyeriana var. granulata]|uniref:Uncharacterized protein n=1 Tax=Oryza meyeriana var. granulata TaxID=110450 RepID=A0A6G1BIV2_9ORYZ|nr:hypothetical protein E2562_013711 [Oryza meyeriana var. granulata]